MADPQPDLRSGPPPRWRVVERDRRLVVIDTGTGAEQRPTPAAAPFAPKTGRLLRQVSFDGSAELTTLALYDANGPRTIRLDPGSAQRVKVAGWIGLAAMLAIAAAMIAQPLLIVPIGIGAANAREPLRRRLTRWLDTVAREGR